MPRAMVGLVFIGLAAAAAAETVGRPREPVDIRGIWTGDKLDKKRAAARGLDVTGMQAPRKVTNETLRYPEALIGRVRGPVFLECTIDQEGVPTDCSVTRGLHALLDAEALRCVKQWRYSPLRIEGEAVPARVEFHLRFMSDRNSRRD